MLATEKEIAAGSRHCPFLDRACIGRRCFLFRSSKLKDRRTGERLHFCGAGGEKGAWHAHGVTKPLQDESPADVIG